jgi:hypothetical protein
MQACYGGCKAIVPGVVSLILTLQVEKPRNALISWLAALRPAADKLGSGSEAGRMQAACQAAWDHAGDLVERISSPHEGSRSTSEAVQAADDMLAHANSVAASIGRSWEATGQAAQQRLEDAQAAATRSCAYLACANLASEVGPAVGEGKGSLRCSGCKTAWYCSTAGSHADWRAGAHRHVCKALAAAWAAEQAA